MAQHTSHPTTSALEAAAPEGSGVGAVPQPVASDIGAIEGLVSVAVVLFTIGVAWGTLRKTVNDLHKSLETGIKPELGAIRERVSGVERKVTTLWEERLASSRSPRVLNARGEALLATGGLRELIEAHHDWLLERVQAQRPMSPYEAEQAVMAAVQALPEQRPECVEALQRVAYTTGEDIDALLFVAGLYARDRLFPELGLAPGSALTSEATIPY